MKIIAVMGTYRKNGTGAGYMAKIEKVVKSLPGVTFEYLWLGDYDIKLCRGCMVCYERGEAACPLRDGYLDAIQKLNDADAAIFYSPTYTLSISGLMKTFFDRSSYVLHRPCFKGRYAMLLTTVGAYGDKSAMGTLKPIVSLMGFTIAGAAGIVNRKAEKLEKYRARVDASIEKSAQKLYRLTAAKEKVKPSLFELVAFHYQKSIFSIEDGGCSNDRLYWKNAGWADKKADYFCDAKIPFLKGVLAKAASKVLVQSGFLVN